jgi:hypothetical protein
MKLLSFGLLATATLALGAAGLSLTSCSQPSIECTSARGAFIAKFYPVSGTDFCAQYPGERIGLQTYNPADTTESCEKRGDDLVCDGTTPDFSSTSLAIQTDTTGFLLYAEAPDTDPTHQRFALGDFSSTEPDDNDFCSVTAMSPAQQVVQFGQYDEEGNPVLDDEGNQVLDPPLDIKYEWSNVNLYVTAAAPGTQLTADLTYTEDGCTATYKVVALYPAVDCGVYDEDGNLAVDDAGNVLLDPQLCVPEAAPDKGYAFGSGINPDFPVNCDPVLHHCVLQEKTAGQPPAIPVLKEGAE